MFQLFRINKNYNSAYFHILFFLPLNCSIPHFIFGISGGLWWNK